MMIANRDHSEFESPRDGQKVVEVEPQSPRFALPLTGTGYTPDEDDPAWPSKSGQAD